VSTRFSGIGMTSQRTRDRLVERLRAKGVTSSAVLEVIRDTPRHIFVDEALASRAYEDSALPIGHGQTISQPYIVARMTELVLAGRRPERVLEIGSGCGYQTAILARLVGTVYSVERYQALLKLARERLYALRLNNVRLRHADGTHGWPEHAPYDGILVAASCPEVPLALCEQLAPGARLIAPVGPRGGQQLTVVTREASGLQTQSIEAVTFVPLVSGTG
jgi:protein-L-isoaspartate(D-aspartate) O-methyltransferase